MHIGMIDYLDIYRRWDRTVAIKESNTLDFVSNAVLGTTKIKYNQNKNFDDIKEWLMLFRQC